MIQLPSDIAPSQETVKKLKEYQDEIDILNTFEERSAKAKSSFSGKNKIGNKAFDEIKEKLTLMCSGARRCAYCEDSVADEVEHIKPKDIYPGHCFRWENYLYACGNCNGPKNNKFAIFRQDNGKLQAVNQKKGQVATEPPFGEDVMINPRIENAMDYCMLDLKSTFNFVIISDSGSKEYIKANYTFNDVLRLNNQREFLRKARENAYGNYCARLSQYVHDKKNGAQKAKLDKMIEGIKSEAHPTVWKEMQRQHLKGYLKKLDEMVDDLFVQCPEALTW